MYKHVNVYSSNPTHTVFHLTEEENTDIYFQPHLIAEFLTALYSLYSSKYTQYSTVLQYYSTVLQYYSTVCSITVLQSCV